MKRVFSMVIALATAVMSYSQSSLVATLSHNGEVSAFYGAWAFREAHDAAQHGDTITLSSGTFIAGSIDKALTIRGAGMYVDSISQPLPTIISGDFYITIPDDIKQHLTMEGLYSDSRIDINYTNGVSFIKNRFKDVYTSYSEMMTFLHCKISNSLSLNNTSYATCVNCYVSNPHVSSPANCEFSNCVVESSYIPQINNSSFTNCIITDTNSENYSLPSSNTVLYCLGTSNNNFDMFRYASNIESRIFTGELNELFKTYTGTYDDNETFELTDAAKIKYLGSDLKQVGMYGGNYPFNPTPTNPRIVKCNVASESTADGKLSIDIEVSSAE